MWGVSEVWRIRFMTVLTCQNSKSKQSRNQPASDHRIDRIIKWKSLTFSSTGHREKTNSILTLYAMKLPIWPIRCLSPERGLSAWLIVRIVRMKARSKLRLFSPSLMFLISIRFEFCRSGFALNIDTKRSKEEWPTHTCSAAEQSSHHPPTYSQLLSHRHTSN